MKAPSRHCPEPLGSLIHEALRVMMQSQSDETFVNTLDTRSRPPNSPWPAHDCRTRLLEVLDSALAIAAEVDDVLESIDSRGSEAEEGEVLKENEGQPDKVHGEPLGDKDLRNESSSAR